MPQIFVVCIFGQRALFCHYFVYMQVQEEKYLFLNFQVEQLELSIFFPFGQTFNP